MALTQGEAVHQPKMAGEANLPVVRIATEENKGYDPKLEFIAGRLDKLAQDQVRLKLPVEQRWIDAVRAYHGKYKTSFIRSLSDAKQSTAYVKMTRSKTVALEARLFDLMFPTDDRNWDVSPTPVPKLADEQKEAETRATNAAAQANEAAQEGNPELEQRIIAEGQDEAGRAQAAAATIEAALKACKLMREEMDDQLVQSRYAAEARDAIHDMCLLGSGILKGPMIAEQTRGRWLPGEGGQYVLEQKTDPAPKVRRVDPWAFFPDMSARRIEECEFFFERHLWTKSDLRKMVRTHGFDADGVRELLREERSNKPLSDPSINNLVMLRSLTEDATGNITGRVVGWEYHGPLECDEVVSILRGMGREEEADTYAAEDDPLKEHRVRIYFCNGVILKITPEWPMDSGEPLYSMANLEDAEGQLFGYGVPTIMSDSQEALNSAWRMALDNGALSVGPQALIAKDQIEPADGSWTFVAKKIWWWVKGAGVPHATKPVEFFNVPNNMEWIQVIIQTAIMFIDIETGISQPQTGEEAKSTPTVGGMAILQNASNIIFRRIVKNVDDGLIAPTMRRLYDWNMQFSKRAEIKGDMQVDARGTSVLLVKEVQAQNLLLLVTQLKADPEMKAALKAGGYPAIEKLFQSMMIKPSEVLVTEDEYKQWLADMASQPPPPSPQQIAAEARIAAAEIAAETRGRSDDTALTIAQLKERTAMLELANNHDMTLAELKVALEKTDKDAQSKERMLLAEMAVDEKNKQDALARGEQPAGSGGSFNEGSDGPK